MTTTNRPTNETADLARQIAAELNLPHAQVTAAIELLQAGNTIPFIARYRKEATSGLDEVALRAIEDAIDRANALQARKATVLRTIDQQGKLTAELRMAIDTCNNLYELEAIYLPFKPKRRTRGSIARERGLQPLADLLLRQTPLGQSKQEVLAAYVDQDKEVPDPDSALQGALDIVAETWAEELPTRRRLIQQALRQGVIRSTVKRGKKEQASKFELYLDHREPVRKVPSHRLLAMLRGASEGMLRISIELDDADVLPELESQWLRSREFPFYSDLRRTVADCFERLLLPATESAVMQILKEKADEEAIGVFGKNLRELLMAPPAGPRVTLGIDPGFRTGCKIAIVDATGKFITHTTIYPTPPRSATEQSAKVMLELIAEHQVELVAIGNGTASRETEAFVDRLIGENALAVTKVMVSEAGASIYSASELAANEFPDLDITVRGAISIARRLQDPLAELVKNDPKSIGVGQYQHDVNQTQLRRCLERVVESCVNQVGVDLNMASAPLLSHVAGIGPKLAGKIVEYRDANGRFSSRKQITQVPKLGKKVFEQAAGFLRIRNDDSPLDNSAVHPESYPVVERMAQRLHADVKSLVGNASLSSKLKADDFVDDKFGLPTVVDIIAELAKPGRDPRKEFRVANFDDRVNKIEDLRPDRVLEGVITNVTHFGAFVDIGVHQDGLIHISQLSNQFVSDPAEIVAVGDIVKVKVLEVDIPRKRISLTRKL